MQKKSSQPAIPTDAKIISFLLKANNVEECDPMVIQQLLEFSYRYATNTLIEAKKYAKHSGKDTLAPEDIRLAVQSNTSLRFTSPPSRDLLTNLAVKVNSKPLPLITNEREKMPPKEKCLFNSEYTITGTKK
ncbi:MAG: transcription initiation factor TFIID subunit 9B [Amphiamblys sp. WSBS2006]|nr:MAG: transcription initiation factor TFIID subunit 9B [Amphiamblys sp. WSBS2006]